MADDMEGLKIVGEIGSLRLQRGDVLVVSTPRKLTVENIEKVYGIMRSIFPGHEVLVADDGLKIEVARKEKADV